LRLRIADLLRRLAHLIHEAVREGLMGGDEAVGLA
jgi:hypothetical protein